MVELGGRWSAQRARPVYSKVIGKDATLYRAKLELDIVAAAHPELLARVPNDRLRAWASYDVIDRNG